MGNKFEIGSLLTVQREVYTPLMSDEHIIQRYFEVGEVLVLLDNRREYHRVMTCEGQVGLVIRTRLRRV